MCKLSYLIVPKQYNKFSMLDVEILEQDEHPHQFIGNSMLLFDFQETKESPMKT